MEGGGGAEKRVGVGVGVGCGLCLQLHTRRFRLRSQVGCAGSLEGPTVFGAGARGSVAPALIDLIPVPRAAWTRFIS